MTKFLGKEFVYVRLSFHQLHYCKKKLHKYTYYIYPELIFYVLTFTSKLRIFLKRKNEEENVTLSLTQLLYTTRSPTQPGIVIFSSFISLFYSNSKKYFFERYCCAILLAAFLVHYIWSSLTQLYCSAF